MARFIALLAFSTLACTAFEPSKVQRRNPSVKAPPARLQWSSATPAVLETGSFTAKISRALAAAPALGPQATSETLSIDASTCVMTAPLDGLTAAVCRTAADAGPTNNYCFTSDVVMKLTDKASATKDPVEREMLEHFLTVECLMYNRGKGLTTWTFEDA